jgi:pyruvate dehydrogenase E1 component beta subunit
MNGAQNIEKVLSDAMGASDMIHLLGESLPLSPVCGSLLTQHPERCHLLPAADSSLVGVAIGLALAGKTPIVELAGPEALWGALQQLGQESSALTGEFSATMILRVPLGPEAIDPSPLLDGMSHLQVASPADAADAGALMQTALSSPGVTVLLEPFTVLGASGGTPGTGKKARVVQEGEHVSLIAWGQGVDAAKSAAKTLSKESISAEVIDLRSLSPLDTETVAQSVNKTGRVVMVGGSSSMLAETIQAAFLRLESPPVQVGQSANAIASKARAAVQY